MSHGLLLSAATGHIKNTLDKNTFEKEQLRKKYEILICHGYVMQLMACNLSLIIPSPVSCMACINQRTKVGKFFTYSPKFQRTNYLYRDRIR